MPAFNKVILMGNLTRDPDLRYIPSGSAVCELSLAINRTWKGNDGQKNEEVTFVEVTLWGRTAEIANQYLQKGRPALIEGRLKLDRWDDKETGKARSKLSVVGESLQLLGSGGGAPPQETQSAASGELDHSFSGSPAGSDDGVPF